MDIASLAQLRESDRTFAPVNAIAVSGISSLLIALTLDLESRLTRAVRTYVPTMYGLP